MTETRIDAPPTWEGAINAAMEIVKPFASEEARQELGSNARSVACQIYSTLRSIRAHPAPTLDTAEGRDGEASYEQLTSLVFCAYQIVGSLAHYTGTFDHAEVIRALDALSRTDEHDPDGDLLPWPREPIAKRTDHDERADVVAFLRATLQSDLRRTEDVLIAADMIEAGEHIGAADKSRK